MNSYQAHKAALAASLATDPAAERVEVGGEVFYLKTAGGGFVSAYAADGCWLGEGSRYDAKTAMIERVYGAC